MVKRYDREPSPEQKIVPLFPIGESVEHVDHDQFADAYFQKAEELKQFLPEGTDVYELAGYLRDVEGEKHLVFPDTVERIEKHPDPEKLAWRRLIFKETEDGTEKVRKTPLIVSIGALVLGAGWIQLRRRQ